MAFDPEVTIDLFALGDGQIAYIPQEIWSNALSLEIGIHVDETFLDITEMINIDNPLGIHVIEKAMGIQCLVYGLCERICFHFAGEHVLIRSFNERHPEYHYLQPLAYNYKAAAKRS